MKHIETEPIRSEFGTCSDVEKIFGIKRGTLYKLHSSGVIKSYLVKAHGGQSGLRLWDMNSIRKFIISQSQGVSDEGCNKKRV